jgi:hypothetical protein
MLGREESTAGRDLSMGGRVVSKLSSEWPFSVGGCSLGIGSFTGASFTRPSVAGVSLAGTSLGAPGFVGASDVGASCDSVACFGGSPAGFVDSVVSAISIV